MKGKKNHSHVSDTRAQSTWAKRGTNLLAHPRIPWLVLFGSLLLSFLLYGNTIASQFVYDDELFIHRTELRDIRYLARVWFDPYIPDTPLIGSWRPLTTASYAFNFIVFGESPVSFRVTSIILHGLVTFLVYALVNTLFQDRLLAILAALLYGLFPIHSEAVSWNKARDELLAALFMLSTWWLIVEAIKNQTRIALKVILVAVGFTAALLSKESGVIFPFVVGASLVLKGYRWNKKLLLIYIVLAIILLIYLLFRSYVLKNQALTPLQDPIFNPLVGESFATRVWTAFMLYILYPVKTFIPIGLSPTYAYNYLPVAHSPFSLATIGGIIASGIFVVALLRSKWRSAVPTIGVAIYTLPIATYLHVVRPTADIMAERWAYFPSVGLAIVGAWVLLLVLRRSMVYAVASIMAALFVYSLVLIPQNAIWHDDVTLARAMVRIAPESVRSYISLGYTLSNMGNIDVAEFAARQAMRIAPNYDFTWDLLAKVLYARGNLKAAKNALERSIALDPSFGAALINHGRISYQMGEYQDAADSFGEFFRQKQKPFGPTEMAMYALSLIKVRQFQRAIDEIYAFMPDKQSDPKIAYALSLAYVKLGNEEKAREYVQGWGQEIPDEDKLKRLAAFEVASGQSHPDELLNVGSALWYR